MAQDVERPTGRRRMRATLVRFGPDLFEDLKVEAESSGISVAQFVREAVVARIAYNAGRRGDRVPGPGPGEAAHTRQARAAIPAD